MVRDAWDLRGRVALVTGATRGIGFAIAEELLRHGATVFITARKQDELDSACAALSALGTVESMAASAGVPADVEASVRRCVERFGSVDVLVNNAATNPQFGPLVDADLGAMRKVWDVNLLGPLWYAREAWHASMRDRGGSIINVASVSGIAPTTMSGAYNIAKAALIHLSRQLALELGPRVRVNTLVPGLVRTRFAQAQLDGADDHDALSARHPLGRIGEPTDLAGAALLLASDAGSWTTGQTIVVDGGALQAWWPVEHSGAM